LLVALDLREWMSIPGCISEDWMHGRLQDGTLTVSLQCLRRAMQDKIDFDLEHAERFFRPDFQLPACRRSRMRMLARIFDYHARPHLMEKMRFKCLASERLGLYVMFRHYVYTAISIEDRLPVHAETHAFEASSKVVDIILLLKKRAPFPGRRPLLRQLRLAVAHMIRSHILAYGNARILPKHRRLQHIADQIEAMGIVADSFLIERVHLLLRDVLGSVRNPVEQEASVLRGICNRQWRSAKDYVLRGMIWKRAAFPRHRRHRLSARLALRRLGSPRR
jgi:hypothetical protein